MSTEDEFSKWLRRKEKTFEENFKFALKSWQSVEFTLNSKYQIILQWLSEQGDLKDEHIVEDDFKVFLKLRAQPGLLDPEVKQQFIEWCLLIGSSYKNCNRKWCELLALLVEFEPLQDIYRMNYELQARVYGGIFLSYEKYLENFAPSGKQFLNTYESEFLASILSNIKKTIKRCGDVKQFESSFTSLCQNAMVNVLLMMRSFNVDFFEELLEIERLLCIELTDKSLMTRIMKMPLHVRLLVLESAIVNRKGINNFIELLLNHVFLPKSSKELDPLLSVTVAAYTIEMLGRHNVNLSFDMSGQTVLQFLGKKIFNAVTEWKDSHLKDVLMLLCAALRLNPLILEENVFEITVWMMLSTKSGDITERQLFEEYLVLLMDMFRRLSRAEKFVANLLRTLNENIKGPHNVFNKKRKHKNNSDEAPPKKKGDAKSEKSEEETDVSVKYLNILFQDFFKPVLSQNKSLANSSLSASASFPKLYDIWPSNPVGVGFSKIITGLVSKPSLVIWKTLLFALKDLIASFDDENELSEKSLFLLDFHAAVLSQYFTGCKLAEQSEKFVEEIATQHQFTLDVLKAFGKCLLGREHNPRTMMAFLETSFYATSFELMLIYYRPDGCIHETLIPSNGLTKLHSFLTPDEWTLIQQRVLNFGKSSCKFLLQRLELQKSQSAMLLLASQQDTSKLDVSFSSLDKDTINSLLKDINAKWLLSQLPRSEKAFIATHLVQNAELIGLILDDLELLEFVALAIYESISSSMVSKHSLLKSLSFDYDKVRQSTITSDCETIIKEIVEVIRTRTENECNKVKKLNTNEIKKHLNLLSQIPIGHLRRQRKTIVFALHVSLYRDLKSAEEEELATQALNIMKNLLHFGQQVLIFKYFHTSCLVKLLPPDSCWDLYEFIFSTLKNEEKGTEQFLQGLAAILQESLSLQKLFIPERKLLLAAIDSLSALSGPCAKRMRKHLDMFLKIFSDYLTSHFNDTCNDGSSKKDKKFVQNTLSGFAPYASVILTKASKALEVNEKETETHNESQLRQTIDDDFRRICKIYIGHSMDYRNPYAIRLMHVALNHRELLHLDQDEIEFVLTNYWTQINEDLKIQEQPPQQNNKTMESAVKMIIGNKTNEDLLITLKSMANNLEAMNFTNILRLLNLIAKCPFSTIKGAIFNEQYKQITFNITLRLSRDEQQLFKDHDLVINLLQCHQTIVDNKMVPISTDTIDSILSFLMDINIKKFNLNDTNLSPFNSLHMTMTDVCASLIKQRHILLMDRIPQYMHVFKDLVQALVWYKSDRQKDTALPSEEMDALSELAMKLESLMHLIGQHSVGVKRVAPFILTFIINLMVGNKRPTTLYNKIKTHIENICYELVGICDHRVGRFILRCSNEAGRQLYELLVKDYQKYHKFKGKV